MTTIKESQKFLFTVSFDDPVNMPPDEKAEPIYKQKDLDEATANAYAQGQMDAKNSFEKQSMDCIHRLEQMINAGLKNQTAITNQIQEKSMIVMRGILSKLVPELMRRNGLSEIERFIQNVIQEHVSAPKLTLRIHPAIYESVSQKIKPMAERAGFGGKILIVADDQLGQQDCRIEWNDGGAEFLPDKTWLQSEELLNKILTATSVENKKQD